MPPPRRTNRTASNFKTHTTNICRIRAMRKSRTYSQRPRRTWWRGLLSFSLPPISLPTSPTDRLPQFLRSCCSIRSRPRLLTRFPRSSNSLLHPLTFSRMIKRQLPGNPTRPQSVHHTVKTSRNNLSCSHPIWVARSTRLTSNSRRRIFWLRRGTRVRTLVHRQLPTCSQITWSPAHP